MGPLAGKIQLERIAAIVQNVVEKGQGTLLTGGSRLFGPGYENGYFYAPTLVTDPSPDSELLHAEVFGPVLPIMRVPDLETAITMANSTRYGLGASVWTSDLSIVREVFSRIQAGIVWVNRHLTVLPEIPFGGVKESGLGRENGVQAWQSYTRTKSLFLTW
jgi:acyl-CoA reductase-like NAD-dependent aldehyde dehydrogenase